MAKAKNSKLEVDNQEEAKPIERTEETEENALKVQEASVSDKAITKKYKLANPNTSYQEEDFTLVGDQEKELPASPSAQLVERIRHGYIVEA